jgi:hypothetical protein
VLAQRKKRGLFAERWIAAGVLRGDASKGCIRVRVRCAVDRYHAASGPYGSQQQVGFLRIFFAKRR